ncbi:hypothetical protein GO986_00060 [Deinococcus sp. HMF7620]|uniref:HTH iclR-type domain-containing protein n=1 Tax=Deinococcus arboris TaxID=2682977 RepID=A0A7C9M3K4_9DEIO|nr:hypothetical protein [Deinococcus arboris]MVN85165.1 hypothetical protein [Deinococcus arboris]
MSRGPGRVQRSILGMLAGGLLDAHTLALHAGASEASTRRALRGLAAAGQVTCLGYGRHGQRWGLPGDVAAARQTWTALWSEDRQLVTARLLGQRSMRSLRRVLIDAL